MTLLRVHSARTISLSETFSRLALATTAVSTPVMVMHWSSTMRAIPQWRLAVTEVCPFHMGGIVDDVPATLQRGEAILTRRGRATIGDDTIAAANRGTAQQEQVIRVETVYQHKAFRPFFRDFATAGGLAQYLPERGRPVGHRMR